MSTWSTRTCIAVGVALGLLAGLGLSGGAHTVDYDYQRAAPPPTSSSDAGQVGPTGYSHLAPTGPGMVGMYGD